MRIATFRRRNASCPAQGAASRLPGNRALRKPLFPEPQPLGAVVLARREPARLPCGLRHPPGRPARCRRILENQCLRSRNLRTAAVRQGDLLRQHRLQRRQRVCPALELDASDRRRQSFHPRRFNPVGFQHPALQPVRDSGLQTAGTVDSRLETRLRHRQFGQPDRPAAQDRRHALRHHARRSVPDGRRILAGALGRIRPDERVDLARGHRPARILRLFPFQRAGRLQHDLDRHVALLSAQLYRHGVHRSPAIRLGRRSGCRQPARSDLCVEYAGGS